MRRRSWSAGALSIPAYRTLWFGSNFIMFGTWMERLAVGWLVLVETDSVLLTAVAFGIRSAPGIVAAPIGGAVADRFSRSRLMFLTAVCRAAAFLAMALVAFEGFSNPWPIFVLVGVGGIINSFEMPARQALITDLTPRSMHMNAISVNSLGMRAVGAGGALASGLVAEFMGVPAALLAAAGSVVAGGLLYLFIPAAKVTAGKVSAPLKGVVSDATNGIRSMAGMPVVSTLLWMAVVVEIFGFAYEAVLPSMARDELSITESGFGTLRTLNGLGAVAGVAALAFMGDFRRKGPLLLAITLGYGLGLFGLSLSESFIAALALITLVGAMAAMFDSMEWTLLQANVPNDMRGRVIGGWVFAIGFGWLGHVAMGAVGEAFGVRWAIGGAGLIVVAASVLALALAPSLRRA